MAGTKTSGRPSETSQLALRAGNEPPKKPRNMKGKYAVELWNLAIESLPHVLRKVDGPVLRLACEAYQRAMDCVDRLANDPTDDEAHKMMIAAMGKFESLAKSIGLNPHSRRVIKPASGETGEEKQEDPFQEWLKRSGGLN